MAKKQATEATEATEAIEVQPLDGMQIIVSTGKYKAMPKDAEYEVSADTAQELIRKGFATLKK